MLYLIINILRTMQCHNRSQSFFCDFKHNTHPFIDSLLMLTVTTVMYTYVAVTAAVCNSSNDCNEDDVDARDIIKIVRKVTSLCFFHEH